jgi:hypothetical protein
VIFSFFTWVNNKKKENKAWATAINSITVELIINCMGLVQESKLLALDNYVFRPFVKDMSWRELKVLMREKLVSDVFKTIDYSYFLLYQAENGFQRLHDFNQRDNVSKEIILATQCTIEKSINQLRKYADKSMDNTLDELYKWMKVNKVMDGK